MRCSTYTPYAVEYEYGGQIFFSTLDKGVTVLLGMGESVPKHCLSIVERFRAAAGMDDEILVQMESGFKGFLEDTVALSLSLSALGLHLGKFISVLDALGSNRSGGIMDIQRFWAQYHGGTFLMHGWRPAGAPGSSRIVVKLRGSKVESTFCALDSLSRETCLSVGECGPENVKVYAPGDTGTTVYCQAGHQELTDRK